MSQKKYKREILTVFQDDYISDTDSLTALFKLKGIIIANDIITCKDESASISFCGKRNDIFNIHLFFISIDSCNPNAIESISASIHNCLEQYQFSFSEEKNKAHTLILSCTLSQENARTGYEHIYETENLFRKFLSLLNHLSQPIDWFDIYAPKEIKNKIKDRMSKKKNNNEIANVNNIYDTDFYDAYRVMSTQSSSDSALSQIIDILEKINDSALSKIESIDSSKEKIKAIIKDINDQKPKSLWDKHQLNKKLKGFETQWKNLSEYRNDIAHNKIITIEMLGKLIDSSLSIRKVLNELMVDICLTEKDESNATQVPDGRDISENEIIDEYESINSIALGNYDESEVDQLQYWFFNTNETHATGVYKAMFENNVVAIYGYGNAGKFNEAKIGQKILAYVNQKGILAVGSITDNEPKQIGEIFTDYIGEEPDDAFALEVKWEAIVPENKGIKLLEATRMGYPLPVRSTFCKLYNTQLAKKLYNTILERAPS
ncbi:hypothetical protein [Thiothrix lacustris]|uniref:hypothetical protein n=1 Tax=Thiothrix lacustris TaxID=525917 RepID=UPI0027E4FAA7|nr:hypothetical protein [Thiothrix lacustris]WMP17692.1 hypothetical protein RCS87_01175 [Thiothrix lacustris]